MRVKTKRWIRPARRLICVSAAVIHLGFVVAAALPGIVFCHRPGGRVAVEFSGPGGSCLCDECEHCLKHLAEAAAAGRQNGPVIDACHCAHEPFLNQADRFAFRRDETLRLPGMSGPVSIVAALLAEPDRAGVASDVRFPSTAPPSLPDQAGVLRC
ncbi:MAG: hypothetical protein NTW38_10345 [Candidatus Aminicenantes bacterium]|nr:hypothetical protein [Candidatus Aminicenantes bacterium]